MVEWSGMISASLGNQRGQTVKVEEGSMRRILGQQLCGGTYQAETLNMFANRDSEFACVFDHRRNSNGENELPISQQTFSTTDRTRPRTHPNSLTEEDCPSGYTTFWGGEAVEVADFDGETIRLERKVALVILL